MHAMMSVPCECGDGWPEWQSGVIRHRELTAACDPLRATAEARRVLSVAEADGVHHDILPGLLRYDLQPMRDLCDALSAFVSAPDPAEYLAAVSR